MLSDSDVPNRRVQSTIFVNSLETEITAQMPVKEELRYNMILSEGRVEETKIDLRLAGPLRRWQVRAR
jgi:hypothetical protein